MSPELCRFLDRAGARYEVLSHSPAYTAQHRAAKAHVSGRHVAKVVMVRAGDWFAMALLCAPQSLDLSALARLAGRRGVQLATENEFVRLFPDCEPGAMPPFGEFYGVDVFLDRELADAGEIVVPGGSHAEEIRMQVGEYIRVARPKIGSLSRMLRAA